MKKIIISLATILAVVLLAGLWFFWPYFSSDPLAYVSESTGIVEVNHGADWRGATQGTVLFEGDSIRTNSASTATLVFFSDSVVRMQENAEINIKKLANSDFGGTVFIEQVKGDVWHTPAPIGLSAYQVETPDGIFTDEGTSFGCSVKPLVENVVLVSSGAVIRTVSSAKTVSATSKPLTVSIGTAPARTASLKITSGFSTTFARSGEIKTTSISDNAALKSWVDKNAQADSAWLVKRREELKNKYSRNIKLATPLLQKIIGTPITNSVIDNQIDLYLQGNTDVGKMIAEGKIPKTIVWLIPKDIIKPVKPQPPKKTQCTCTCSEVCTSSTVYGCAYAEKIEKSGGTISEWGTVSGNAPNAKWNGAIKKQSDGSFKGECKVCSIPVNIVDVATPTGDCTAPCKTACDNNLKTESRKAADDCRTQLEDACKV